MIIIVTITIIVIVIMILCERLRPKLHWPERAFRISLWQLIFSLNVTASRADGGRGRVGTVGSRKFHEPDGTVWRPVNFAIRLFCPTPRPRLAPSRHRDSRARSYTYICARVFRELQPLISI